MTFDELFPLKAVINLDRRPDRLASCREEFKKIDAKPIRKSGIIFSGGSNSYTNGVVGCLASHYQVLQAALFLNTNVFIFEDDVHFLNDTFNPAGVIGVCCDHLENMEWDMFYIGGNILKPMKRVSSSLAKLSHCQSTVAYGVNKNFIQKLLEYIDIGNISAPIDVIYADRVIPNHNCYISIPMCVTQRNDYSDIEGKNVQYEDYLEKRYWDNLK